MYTYAVDVARLLVTVTFSGIFTDADAHTYIADMLTAAPYGAGWRTLADVMGVENLKLTGEGVRRVVGMARNTPQLDGSSLAFLAHPGTAAYGLARMYQILAEEAAFRVGVFTDRDEAMQWLLADGAR